MKYISRFFVVSHFPVPSTSTTGVSFCLSFLYSHKLVFHIFIFVASFVRFLVTSDEGGQG